MHLLFLIPLTSALISGYIFKKCADEMAYLTGLATIISTILALVLAPWQIQLAILAFVIISTRTLLRLNEYKLTQIENSQEKPINQSNVSSEQKIANTNATEGEKVRMYRGSLWRSNQLNVSPSQKANFNLKYRGARTNNQINSTPHKVDTANINLNNSESK